MADVSPPAIPPPTGLYPQPPKSQQEFSPLQAIDLIGGLQRNEQMRRELAGRQALGNAYQGALQPDGTLDPEKLRAGLKDPAASWMLPEAMSHILTQQRSQFDLRSTQDQAVRDIVGTLPKNPSKEDLYNAAASLARRGVPSPMIVGWLSAVSNDPKGIAHGVATTQNMAAGPAATMARVAGPPGPGGEPQSVPLGEANVRGAMPVGTPLGSEASSNLMQTDLARARSFGQEMFPLQQALEASNELKAKYGEGYFGPGSKGRQDFKSYFYALSPTIARWAGIDPNELKDYAKADKYLTQAVQTRAAGFGAHTDQQLATTISGSPNVHINDLAVDDVLKAMIATRRAEQAQTMEARKAGPIGYSDAAGSWSARNDIRAFSLDQLTPEGRAKLLGSLKKGTPEWTRFNNSLRSAYENGLMTPPGKQSEQPHPAATKAPDGNWYLPDPNRAGKVMRVTPSMLPQLGG